MNAVNLNHCARLVFLSRAIDLTNFPYYAPKAVLLLLLPITAQAHFHFSVFAH